MQQIALCSSFVPGYIPQRGARARLLTCVKLRRTQERGEGALASVSPGYNVQYMSARDTEACCEYTKLLTGVGKQETRNRVGRFPSVALDSGSTQAEMGTLMGPSSGSTGMYQ